MSASNPPTPTPAPAPTKVVAPKNSGSLASGSTAAASVRPPLAADNKHHKPRKSLTPRSAKAQTAAHQVSPTFQPRATRSRVGSNAEAPTSPPMTQGMMPTSPTHNTPAGIRRSRHTSADLFQRRHRRTMSDTPTSPFWSPSFEFMHSEDPEVELEDEKYLSHVKVDEVAPPTEEERKKQLLRAISFPASLKKDHHRTTSIGSSPLSPPTSPDVAVKSPARRRTLGALNCNAKGRPIVGSPNVQALARAGKNSKHPLYPHMSPQLARKGSAGPLSPVASKAFTPESSQRARRARRSLPRRANTDLTANRPEAR